MHTFSVIYSWSMIAFCTIFMLSPFLKIGVFKKIEFFCNKVIEEVFSEVSVTPLEATMKEALGMGLFFGVGSAIISIISNYSESMQVVNLMSSMMVGSYLLYKTKVLCKTNT